MLLDETEFRQVKAVGGGGLVLSLDDGGETTFQGAQAPAALQLAFEVSAELLLPLGEQVETAPDLGLGLGELSLGEQRLAQGPMGLGELRFEPDGLAVVVDGFLQSGLVLRGNAERVPGRGPLGVTVVGLHVVSRRLAQGSTADRVEGFHALRVVSRPPRPAGPWRAGRHRASGGPGHNRGRAAGPAGSGRSPR